MKIDLMKDGKKLTILLEGRLDSFTAPELDAVITKELNDVDELVLDLENLEYISSAGLRVVLKAQKTMGAGRMTVVHINEVIMEVFEITGFTDILTIE